MKIRIAEVVAVYPPYGGGLGVVARQNAQMLAGDCEVTVFSPRYARIKESESRDGSVRTVFLRPFFAFGNGAILPQLVWKLRSFDVIHLHYPFFGGFFFPVLAARLWRKKLVVTYHMDLAGGRKFLGFIFAIANAIAPVLMHFSDIVLVTSLDYARASAIAGFLRRHPEKIRELPNSVDTKVFLPRADSPLLAGEPTILFVGGLDRAHYFKGVDILLGAAEKLSAMRYRLWIVGDGDLRLSYEASARRAGLSDRVSFFGSLTASALADAYNQATFVVLPSVDRSEAFGIVLIEAGACGKPVIASDLPGVRSVVENGVTGFLVPPGDVATLAKKLRFFIENPDQAHRMGAAGRHRVLSLYSNTTVGNVLRSIVLNL